MFYKALSYDSNRKKGMRCVLVVVNICPVRKGLSQSSVCLYL
jgi:hypothetical protein